MSMPLPSGSCTRYSAKGMRSGRAAPHTGLLRPGLHFLIALDVKPEVIEADRFFLSLIQKRQIEIAIGDENGGTLGPFDFLHIQDLTVKIRESLRARRIKGDMTNRHGSLSQRHIKSPLTKPDNVAIRVAHFILDSGIRIAFNQILLSICVPCQFHTN